MSITEGQARRLGQFVAEERRRQGLSVRQLADSAALKKTWVSSLEQGRYLDPAPERLARLAEALSLDPKRFDRMTQGAMSNGLPEPGVYFRSKMALTPEESEKVMRYIDRMRRAA